MTSRGVRFAAVLGVGLAWLAAVGAGAHTRSLSYSTWELDPAGATVRIRISLLDLTRLGLDPTGERNAAAIGSYLARHLSLSNDGGPCPVGRPPLRVAAPTGWAVYAWRVDCPAGQAPNPGASGPAGAGERTLESRVLLDVAPSHLHFARVERADGGVVDRVLSDAEPRWTLGLATPGQPAAAAEGASDSFGAYLGVGVEHILSGWDHLAFLLALLLLAESLGQVAALVTAFTLAHSVTLALATLGWVEPEPAAVEALIGFSIALVAAENGWILSGRGRILPVVIVASLLALAAVGTHSLTTPAVLGLALFSLCHFALLGRAQRPAGLRAAVAFGFGLVHGFGFAGVLAEMALPTHRLVPALFGFNLGVEAGQLAVVAGAWPLLLWAGRSRGGLASSWISVVGSAAICGFGIFWFAVRTLGDG